AGPIALRAEAAEARTQTAASLRAAARAGTAAGPIDARAPAAHRRTVASLRAAARGGTVGADARERAIFVTQGQISGLPIEGAWHRSSQFTDSVCHSPRILGRQVPSRLSDVLCPTATGRPIPSAPGRDLVRRTGPGYPNR